MDDAWISDFLSFEDLEANRTGHATLPAGAPGWGGRFISDEVREAHRRQLGLGWLYYGLVRSLSPQTVLSIGSGRGFVPILLARAQLDRGGPPVAFVDPSFDDDFWKDAGSVRKWFATFGVEDHINHHLMTTEQFAAGPACAALPPIDLLFIDGGHFYETVETDFRLMSPKLAPGATVLFHDTVSRSANPRWSGPRQVLLDVVGRDSRWQLLDLPFGAGLTILREAPPQSRPEYLDALRTAWPDPDSTRF
jgi:predicted O-methyltransferase YrrM